MILKLCQKNVLNHDTLYLNLGAFLCGFKPSRNYLGVCVFVFLDRTHLFELSSTSKFSALMEQESSLWSGLLLKIPLYFVCVWGCHSLLPKRPFSPDLLQGLFYQGLEVLYANGPPGTPEFQRSACRRVVPSLFPPLSCVMWDGRREGSVQISP